MITIDLTPKDETILHTLAMPADTNANGDISGGWLILQTDTGSTIMAKEIAQDRVVAVCMGGMTFLRPVAIDDMVCYYARCAKRGSTSVTINIEVWVKKVFSESISQCCRATETLFVYAIVDSQGKPQVLSTEQYGAWLTGHLAYRKPSSEEKKRPIIITIIGSTYSGRYYTRMVQHDVTIRSVSCSWDNPSALLACPKIS